MADDGYTTILRTTDPTQGELFAEMLRREGIEARFHQVRGTLIGMPANLIEMTVDVPTETEARARELLTDLEYVGAAEASEQQAADQAVEPQGDAELAARDRIETGGLLRSRRHPLFAVSFALFLPGGAHLYARRPWTALVLALGVVGCFATAIIWQGTLAFDAAFFVWPVIVVCDAVGGVRAARADLRGERPSRLRQLARGLGLVFLSAVVGVAPRVLSAVPAMRSAAQLEKYKVSCTGTSIAIENGTDGLRALDLSNFRVAAISELGEERYEVGPLEPRRLSLAPGERGAVTPQVADWLARSCKFAGPDPTKAADMFGRAIDDALQGPAPRPLYCGYLFSFVARDMATDETLTASGRCIPPTPTNPKAGGGLDLVR